MHGRDFSLQTLLSLARAWHRCEITAEYELLPGPVGRDKRLKDQPEIFMLHLVFLSINKCSPCPPASCRKGASNIGCELK